MDTLGFLLFLPILRLTHQQSIYILVHLKRDSISLCLFLSLVTYAINLYLHKVIQGIQVGQAHVGRGQFPRSASFRKQQRASYT